MRSDEWPAERAEQVHPFIVGLLGCDRAPAAFGPKAGECALLAEACFIFEPKLNALMRKTPPGSRDERRKFF